MKGYIIFNIVSAAISILTTLTISSIRKGWIFLVLAFLSVFLWIDIFGEHLLVIVYIFWVLSFAIGTRLMLWKLRRNRFIDKNKGISYKIPKQMLSCTKCGIVFGGRNKKYVIREEQKDGHVLIVGGTRSGKTSCIAIPTLRAWKYRAFVVDIKGELYQETKDEANRKIKIFNPLDKNTYGYNPFFVFTNCREPAQEAFAMAGALIPLSPTETSPYWCESAQNMLTGIILYFYDCGYSFIDTLEKIQTTEPKELLNIIYSSNNQQARMYINSFVKMADETFFAIHSHLSNSIVKIADDKDLKFALSRHNNIMPHDLEALNDIYLIINENLLGKWNSILTLMVSQFMRHFEQRTERKSTPILFVLDEFPRLGKIPTIIDGLATLQGKNITICPIIQSLAQLDYIYGKDVRRIILDNCQYKAILSANDVDTQEIFSRGIGTFNDKHKAFTLPFFSILGWGKNIAEVEKRRIKPEDFATLSVDNALILTTQFGNFKIEKRPYYQPETTEEQSILCLIINTIKPLLEFLKDKL